MRCLACVIVLSAVACTSTDEPAAAPMTTAAATATQPPTTVPVVVEPLPLPTTMAVLRLGETYVYENNAHCDMKALQGLVAGSYWDVVPSTYDYDLIQKLLAGDHRPYAVGLLGELTYAASNEMVFIVPGTRLRMTYEPTSEPRNCV